MILQVKRFLIRFRELTKETYRKWRIMFALLVLLDTALSIAQVIIYYFSVQSVDRNGVRAYIGEHYDFALNAQYLHMILYCMSVIECATSISGLGLDQYFFRNVNKIEFACGIVLGSIMMGITINDSMEIGALIHPFNYDIIMLINIFMWLRIVQLYSLIIAMVPRVIHKVDRVYILKELGMIQNEHPSIL